MGLKTCHPFHQITPIPSGDKMENPQAYIDEMFNKEITKLRREIYEAYESAMITQFCPNDYQAAWRRFNSVPIMDSLNRRSLEMIVEACEAAKRYRENIK